MGQRIIKTTVKYEKGFIYYIKNDDGFIGVYRAEMGRKKK